MKITRGELKKLIAEEIKAALKEERPAKQRKPWGADPYTGKTIRWGGKGSYQDRQDWSAGHPGEPDAPTDDDMYVNRSKDDKIWAQAAYESKYMEKEAFADAGVDYELDSAILMDGFEALPDNIRLTPTMQQKYVHYYKKMIGQDPKCGNFNGPNLFGEWTGPCGEGGRETDELYSRPWMNKGTPEYEHYKDTGSFEKDGVSIYESISSDDLKSIINQELKSLLEEK